MRFKILTVFAFLVIAAVLPATAQDLTVKDKPAENTEKKAKKSDDNKKPDDKTKSGDASKTFTPEQIAESVIAVYGGFGGREYLKQIRKTTIERGKVSLVGADGKTEQSSYERLIMRGDSLNKERVRVDQEYPNGRFALVYNNDKIFGLFNDAVFSPREDATKSFNNQIWHGLEALLRYKENEATVTLGKSEKLMSVDYHVVDVTDKQNRKTRFYISQKSLRVMMIEYIEDEVKYRRKFYDYNYVQGTLVPFRSVLWANDKQVEETNIQTVSFGQKVEEGVFNES